MGLAPSHVAGDTSAPTASSATDLAPSSASRAAAPRNAPSTVAPPPTSATSPRNTPSAAAPTPTPAPSAPSAAAPAPNSVTSPLLPGPAAPGRTPSITEPATVPSEAEPLAVRLRHAPVTFALLAVCVLLHAVTLVLTLVSAPDPLATALESLWSLSLTDSLEAFRSLGALELSRIWLEGEWWRVLTTSLLHGSLLHLVLNGIALVSIGEWVERACGPLRTLALFALASLGGALASLAWCESPVVLGASAGILGQAGALWLARHWGTSELKQRLDPISPTSLGLVILLCLGLGLVVPGIAQAGHLGGLAVGLLLGAAWLVPRPLLRAALLAVTVAVLGVLAWLGAAPTHRLNYYGILGKRMSDDARYAEAVILFKEVLARDPANVDHHNTLAYTLALAGIDLDEAESLARTALAADPLNASYLDTLGWIFCRQGFVDDGLRVLHAAAALASERFPELDEHLAGCASAAVEAPSVSRETPEAP